MGDIAGSRLAAGAGAIALALAFSPPGAAQVASAETAVVRIQDGQLRPLSGLATGEQGIISRQTGELAFAGRRLQLDDFIGVAGYSSEVAYLLVLAGSARLGEATARPGQMLLLPPFGAEPMVERFDAARLKASWSEQGAAAAPEAYAALDDVADGQRLGVAFGRLRRTSFNVAASGAAGQERQRRAVVGGVAVRDIRFSANSAPTTLEYRIIASFARALAQRDAAAVAEFLDPVPFGGMQMDPASQEARLVLARSIVAQADWPHRLSGLTATRGSQPNQWLLSGPNGLSVVTLRSTPDFAFVSAVSTEERR